MSQTNVFVGVTTKIEYKKTGRAREARDGAPATPSLRIRLDDSASKTYRVSKKRGALRPIASTSSTVSKAFLTCISSGLSTRLTHIRATPEGQ